MSLNTWDTQWGHIGHTWGHISYANQMHSTQSYEWSGYDYVSFQFTTLSTSNTLYTEHIIYTRYTNKYTHHTIIHYTYNTIYVYISLSTYYPSAPFWGSVRTFAFHCKFITKFSIGLKHSI